MPPIQRSGPPPVEDDFDEKQMFGDAAEALAASGMMSGSAPTSRRPQMPPRMPMAPQVPTNPLAKYFRTPGLHVRLPTDGAFLPEGGIQLTMSGEVEVWPMRTADELLLKSPDALMSGYAVEKLLQSCVPALQTPRLVSQPDLDVLLLAIRAATMGEKMEVNARCPSCGTDNAISVHLPSVLASMKPVPHENPVRLSDEVMGYVRPFNLHEATQIALASFEEARKLQSIETNPDAKPLDQTKQMNASYERLAKLNVSITAGCLIAVVTPEGEVIDPVAIGEFVSNIPSEWFHKIERTLQGINELGIDKKLHMSCVKCKHEWSTELEFNPSSFFG